MSDEPAAAGGQGDGGNPTTTPVPSGDPPKTFSQDQVNDLIAKEKGKIQARFEGHDDLKAKAAELDDLKAANATELEKAQGKLTKAEQAKATAEAQLLRYQVAQEKEVPAKLVPLLTAADKEGLEAQADLILENAKAEPTPQFDGGARDPAPEAKTPEEQHNDLAVQLFGIPR